MAKRNVIYYGDGEITIICNESILGFHIEFEGNYNIESYNPENFLISYNNGTMVGVGLGTELGGNPFLKYTGDLRIKECKVVTPNMEYLNIIPKLIRNDKFNANDINFNRESLKFEDLNRDGVFGYIPMKSKVKIITKNLNTKGSQYKLDGEDYIGDYHLHHTGVAMTGSDHTENSKVLELTNKKQRIKHIINRIRRQRGGY